MRRGSLHTTASMVDLIDLILQSEKYHDIFDQILKL